MASVPRKQMQFYGRALHDLLTLSDGAGGQELPTVDSWRARDRQKTVAAALVLCLNVGVDPPDVVKPDPSARLECWLDPASMPAQKALEAIGKELQAQYECECPPIAIASALSARARRVPGRCRAAMPRHASTGAHPQH